MNIRTNLHAGADALRTCQKERDYWKGQAEYMEQFAKSGSVVYPQPGPQPQPSPQPVSGGWVSGMYYSDHSGWCG